jgi:hypothetical protein
MMVFDHVLEQMAVGGCEQDPQTSATIEVVFDKAAGQRKLTGPIIVACQWNCSSVSLPLMSKMVDLSLGLPRSDTWLSQSVARSTAMTHRGSRGWWRPKTHQVFTNGTSGA